MPTATELRAFLERPWPALRRSKDEFTSARVAREGADAAFELAEILRAHAIAVGAEMTADARRDDLATAVRLKRLLDRASRRSARAR